MLLVLLRLPRVLLLCFGPFLSFLVVFCLCCIVLFSLSYLPKRHDILFKLGVFLFYHTTCFFVSLVLLSVIALYTLLTYEVLHYNVVHYNIVSVSCFCDHRTCMSLGGRISTDNGCAGCQRVKRMVQCEEHTHVVDSCVQCQVIMLGCDRHNIYTTATHRYTQREQN